MFALTFQSRVAQIAASQFPVHPSLVWVDIGANPQGIAAGWSYDGAVFTAPPPPPAPPTNAQLIDAEIARNVAFDALLIVLAGDKGKTKEQLIADMKLAKP